MPDPSFTTAFVLIAIAASIPASVYAFDQYFMRIEPFDWLKPVSFAVAALILAAGVMA
ncbi:hypothetical protein [Ponticaulis profundi]|uniref:Uncharacterized protein n=1 Tax=Ponticaulis profundi TaxID=2665222 RepID=A0ABW1S8J8_9PROT